MNDGGEEASGTLMMNNEVFDETRYFFYSVFRFVQRNKKNISVIKKRIQIIQQTEEGATSDNRVYLQESKTH